MEEKGREGKGGAGDATRAEAARGGEETKNVRVRERRATRRARSNDEDVRALALARAV